MRINLLNTTNMYDERRLKSEMNTAKRIGYEDGHKEGRAEGRAEVALRMLDSGMDISQIAQLTGLSIEEVSVLAAKR